MLVATLRRAERGGVPVERSVPLRALASLVALLAAFPLLDWRLDPVMAARPILDSPAIHSAQRLVATTAMRSALRLATGLPRVDDLDGRDLVGLLESERGVVVIEWANDLAASGQLPRLQVVARGFLHGRELLAVVARIHPPDQAPR